MMKGSVQNDSNLHDSNYSLAFADRLCCAWRSRLWWWYLGSFRLWSTGTTSTPFHRADTRASLGGESRLADFLDRGTLYSLPIRLFNTFNGPLRAVHTGADRYRATWRSLYLSGPYS